MATLVEPVVSMPVETAPEACSLDNYLAMPDHTMDGRIAAARARLGKEALILGHHYQRDEVIRFADYTGDSYKLSKIASESDGRYILFCGVHFMAESADILAQPWQQVILPDLNAGCSMADMADISQVEECWDKLHAAGLDSPAAGGLVPLTYMNSTAAIKAFCGERGGLVCTSSNAKAAFNWAFARGSRFFSCPINTWDATPPTPWEFRLSETVVWDPYQINGGVTPDRLRAAKVILWKGHCSVHQRFLPEHADRVRAAYPGIQVIVHPECRLEVCQKADAIGSTEGLIQDYRRRAGRVDVRRRHGDPPGEPAGQAVCSAGQESDHAGRVGMPVHDHVPDLAAAPGVGAGKSGGGPRGESHSRQ